MSKKKIVIVGGVAGGASAAARARRLSEESEIILFERGPYISFANCGLPYHIGGEIKDRDSLLVQTPESMEARFNVDVRINSEVMKIDKKNKLIEVKDKAKDEVYSEAYDVLILSPGASAIRPPIPGIDNKRIFTLRNIPDMDLINGFIAEQEARHAVVVGGGYIGLEMVEALRNRKVEVTVVELAEQVMGPVDPEMATLLHQELRLHGVDLRLGVSVTAFDARDDGIDVKLSNGDNIVSDMVILAIGVRPENLLAQEAGLELGELGGIAVNQHMQTSDANIYAVGDAIEVQELVSGKQVLIPLAGPANRQGRIAADNIFGRKSVYKSTQGTGICKVFKQTVGMTGLNEKILQRFKIAYEKIYVHPVQHAGYYPGATQVSLKLLFAPENGKILGAQAVGANGIDKRIDVLAMAIRCDQTVYDLEEAELSYAPPYGSAKDVINYAGFVASNFLKGDMGICHVDEILHVDDRRQLLIDVRTPLEFEMGIIPGAINIPVDLLRSRLADLPRDRELLVYCKVGLRGYIAGRILQQHGFQVRNLSGGYTTYKMVVGGDDSEAARNMCSDTGAVGCVGDVSSNMAVNDVAVHIDARGVQCPGPIQKLKQALDKLQAGELLSIATSDPGFVNDAPAWCKTTGHELVEMVVQDSGYLTIIRKSSELDNGINVKNRSIGAKQAMTIVLFSGDFDKAMAAFIIANGAVTMGYEVTIFSTFWGLNVLRKDSQIKVQKNFIETMLGKMMPRGANKLALSKMHMLGMGTKMIKGIMKKKQVVSLPDLISDAIESGVNLVGCSMTMDMMGIRQEELLDGVEKGGVAMYLNKAGEGSLNLFI